VTSERGRVPVLWVCGLPGVGKSTVAWEVFSSLKQREAACAYVDIDQLGICYPGRSDCGHEVKAPNLGAVLDNFRRAGAQIVIVSGVLDAPAIPTYTEAAPTARLDFCRLRLPARVLRARLAARGMDPALVEEVIGYADELDRSMFPSPRIETDGASVAEVVARVLERAGTLVVDAPIAVTESSLQTPSGYAGPVLWLYGPTGVGKSTVGWKIFDDVRNSGVRVGFVDLEQIGFLSPASADDPGNHRVKSRNLAAVCRTYAAQGARYMVVVGQIASAEDKSFYMESLPRVDWSVCRLRAGRRALTDRIKARGAGGGPRLAGDALVGQPPEVLALAVERAVAEDPATSTDPPGDDLWVDTDDLTVDEVATRVRAMARARPDLRPEQSLIDV
jgi:adenylylsulfate kinase-like enzyme